MKYSKLLLLLLFSGLSLAFFPKLALASTLSLSPSSGTIAKGSTLQVQVRVNTAGEPAIGVTAVLTYPADKLDVAYISGSGSAFGIEGPSSGGGGTITISRGSLNPVGGTAKVATIGFKGKADGDAKVSFVGGSGVSRTTGNSNAKQDSLNLGASTGGNYKVGGAAATTTTSSTTTKVAGPAITELKVTSVATDSATITWKTDKKSDTYVEYGSDKDKYILNASNDTLVTDHTITIKNELLIPGLTYYFRARSKDATGNETASEQMSFQLKGYSIKVKLSDLQGKMIANTDVVLYSDPRNGKTDTNGEVFYDNVSPGKHVLIVKLASGEKAQDLNVQAIEGVQNIDLKVDAGAKPSTSSIFDFKKLAPIVGFIILVLVITIGLVIYNKRRGPRSPSEVKSPVDLGPTSASTEPKVFVSDSNQI